MIKYRAKPIQYGVLICIRVNVKMNLPFNGIVCNYMALMAAHDLMKVRILHFCVLPSGKAPAVFLIETDKIALQHANTQNRQNAH